MTDPLSFHIRGETLSETEKLQQRRALLQQWKALAAPELFATTFDPEVIGKKNCENLIGQIEIPVGVVGPILAQGEVLNQEVLLPIATTEGALIASLNRGGKVINHAQGCKVWVKKIGMTRAPVFECQDGSEAQRLVKMIAEGEAKLKELTESTSHHLHWLGYDTWVRGRLVYVRCRFDTEEAMGMNMVTIALQHAFAIFLQGEPWIKLLAISSNVCSDKKASLVNQLLGRGYWVQAEVKISESTLQDLALVTSQQLRDVYQAKILVGSNLAGSFSQNMQAANVIAGLYAATGQDLAHVGESSQASVSLDQTDDGVYMAVTLPDVVVGTVGGGTGLPAQTQARNLMLKTGAITAQQLAAAVGVGVLAGEISGLAALANNTLAAAHQQLGRSTT